MNHLFFNVLIHPLKGNRTKREKWAKTSTKLCSAWSARTSQQHWSARTATASLTAASASSTSTKTGARKVHKFHHLPGVDMKEHIEPNHTPPGRDRPHHRSPPQNTRRKYLEMMMKTTTKTENWVTQRPQNRLCIQWQHQRRRQQQRKNQMKQQTSVVQKSENDSEKWEC